MHINKVDPIRAPFRLHSCSPTPVPLPACGCRRSCKKRRTLAVLGDAVISLASSLTSARVEVISGHGGGRRARRGRRSGPAANMPLMSHTN